MSPGHLMMSGSHPAVWITPSLYGTLENFQVKSPFKLERKVQRYLFADAAWFDIFGRDVTMLLEPVENQYNHVMIQVS